MNQTLITMQDDSMFCHKEKIQIPQGAELLIDTQAAITVNKIIAAIHTKTGQTIIRRLETINGKHYLTPLNNHYRRIELNGNYKIVGVAITVYQNI